MEKCKEAETLCEPESNKKPNGVECYYDQTGVSTKLEFSPQESGLAIDKKRALVLRQHVVERLWKRADKKLFSSVRMVSKDDPEETNGNFLFGEATKRLSSASKWQSLKREMYRDPSGHLNHKQLISVLKQLHNHSSEKERNFTNEFDNLSLSEARATVQTAFGIKAPKHDDAPPQQNLPNEDTQLSNKAESITKETIRYNEKEDQAESDISNQVDKNVVLMGHLKVWVLSKDLGSLPQIRPALFWVSSRCTIQRIQTFVKKRILEMQQQQELQNASRRQVEMGSFGPSDSLFLSTKGSVCVSSSERIEDLMRSPQNLHDDGSSLVLFYKKEATFG